MPTRERRAGFLQDSAAGHAAAKAVIVSPGGGRSLRRRGLQAQPTQACQRGAGGVVVLSAAPNYCKAATRSAPGSVELARRAGRFCAIWSI